MKLRNSPLISGDDDWLSKEKAKLGNYLLNQKDQVNLGLKSACTVQRIKKINLKIFLCSNICIIEDVKVLVLHSVQFVTSRFTLGICTTNQ